MKIKVTEAPLDGRIGGMAILSEESPFLKGLKAETFEKMEQGEKVLLSKEEVDPIAWKNFFTWVEYIPDEEYDRLKKSNHPRINYKSKRKVMGTMKLKGAVK